jgi:DNA-binding MarR family transcriptional regulator
MQHVSPLQLFTQAILEVRTWEDAHLPMEQSMLAYDLLALVTHRTVHSQPISLKHLFILLNYSEAGIRKQLRRCIRDEWLRLEDGTQDRRVRYVVAEPKLVALFECYADVLQKKHAMTHGS